MNLVYRNDTDQPVAFRDDAGKRILDPGEAFALTGAQHAPLAESVGLVRVADIEPVAPDATVADLREAAADAGVKVPAKASKAELREAVVAVAGEAPAEPEGEPV